VAEAPLEVCLTCHESPPPQLGTVVWGEHAGVVRDALLALKHARHDELAAPLGQRLALRLAEAQWIDAVDVVTAVPTHFLYTVKRGWSAASLLARVAARDLGKPFRATLRRCGLDRQVTGSRARRLALSASAFRARCRLDDQVVLLIDDVTTTGTTLAHAARALLGAQAAAVYCAALTYASDPRRLA
jgi:competence protein ComFC